MCSLKERTANNLPILKGDAPRCGAEIIKASSNWLSLPVDDQSSRYTSESHHREMEKVVWWWYLMC